MKSGIALANMQRKLKGKASAVQEVDASMEEVGQSRDMDPHRLTKKHPGSPLDVSDSGAAEISDDRAA